MDPKDFYVTSDDPVNHPAHYNDGKIEVIDYIEDKGLGFHLGNAVKYISRAGKKDQAKAIEDLEKAVWYIQRYIEKQRAGNVEKETLTTPARDLISEANHGYVNMLDKGIVLTHEELSEEQLKQIKEAFETGPVEILPADPEPAPKRKKIVHAKKTVEQVEAEYARRKIKDFGKLRALKEAGWHNTEIAKEFHCTSQTVANTLAKLKKLEEAQA